MKVTVFGAGGFVGGWICELLATQSQLELIACVRRWNTSIRLARRGIDIRRVDLEDVTERTPEIADAEIVINASMPPPDREPDLALRLYSACRDAGVRTFVQFSSVAVYGNKGGLIDESVSPEPNNSYGRGKRRMEELLLTAAANAETQLFILRPSIVYGPFSDIWTIGYARRIKKGRWRSLGSAGGGICNLVHGEDVARAAMLAAFSGRVGGPQILNINGPEYVSWNEYIERFGDELGIEHRVDCNPTLFKAKVPAIHMVRQLGSWVKRNSLHHGLLRSRPLVQTAQSLVNAYPTPYELQVLQRKAVYSWSRAEASIDFVPSMPIADGLRQSAEWCRLHGIV